MKVAVVACSSLALVVAGCGALGQSSTDADSAEAAKQPLRLTKTQARDTARAMLVRPSDLPSGWSQVDANDGRHAKNASYLRASGADVWCRRFLSKNVPVLADEQSPTFANELGGAFVSSAAAVFTSERTAKREYRRLVRTLRSKTGRECFFGAFKRAAAAASGVSFGKGHVRPLAYRVGERLSGFRSSFRIHTVCGCATGYFSFLVVQERQAAGWILAGRFSRPLAKELETRIARRVAERMKLAQAARDRQA